MNRLRSYLLSILFLSAAYLFAWPTATIPYEGTVILHFVAGVVFALLCAPFMVRKILHGEAPERVGWSLVSAGSVLGIILIFTGAPRSMYPLLGAHIGTCVAGGAILAADWAGHRGWLAGSHGRAALRYAFSIILAGGIAAGGWWIRTVPWDHANRIENPSISPASMDNEGDGPSGPFFPSSAQTLGETKIPKEYFMESQTCQGCHSDIYNQWESSAHHFSSFNNQWYRKSIEYMQDVRGIQPSKWCAGCHDPALLFSGEFDKPVREIENTPAGQAGLGCMMCHSITRVKSTMGQGDYRIEVPALHDLATSNNPVIRRLHDFLVELNPEPHRRTFLKPYMRTETPDFCSVCHKVHLDVPVNHYRWTRGFNDYDNWQASGVSGQGARSFYYPPHPETCADCHMPMAPLHDTASSPKMVHQHRFLAANTALPFANRDQAQLEATEQFLKDKEVSVDIFALSPETAAQAGAKISPAAPPMPGFETTFAVGEEAESEAPAGAARAAEQAGPPASPLTAPLNRVAPAVRRGDSVRVDVVVRTRKVGHFFPGGTVDAFDCWLELSATDENRRAIFWSGLVEDQGHGPVDPGAHFYHSVLIDAHGHPINKRNAWAARATVYVHLIPPGAADTVHYRLKIPRDAGSRIQLHAKLNYRKFAWINTQFSFAGVKDPNDASPSVTSDYDDTHWVYTGDTSNVSGEIKSIPDLPIVTLAEDKVELKVLPASAPEPPQELALDPSDWTRWNDYGIGLLLQGDLKGALGAFDEITQVAPQNPDGWVNIGRARFQEGNLPAAKQALEKALALSPSLARAHFFYAKVLRNQGRYDEAAQHLRQVLEQYPRDRVVHDELGRIFFLERRYDDAVREFDATLGIDPEDLEANYNLMLCYTGLGQSDRAGEFQKRYLRFKADESSQTLTGPYLREHPEDNVERQPIHEHVSVSAQELRAAQSAATAANVHGGSD
ncbi:MAG: tetratricopeptide repeat protein [Candidatus Acidiferrales bacterium]